MVVLTVSWILSLRSLRTSVDVVDRIRMIFILGVSLIHDNCHEEYIC